MNDTDVMQIEADYIDCLSSVSELAEKLYETYFIIQHDSNDPHSIHTGRLYHTALVNFVKSCQSLEQLFEHVCHANGTQKMLEET